MVEKSPASKHSEPSQLTTTLFDSTSPAPSPETSVAAQQRAHSDGELVNFIVAVFRLLVITTLAFFRMGPQSFARAVGSPMVGNALRALTDELQHAVANSDDLAPSVDETGARSIEGESREHTASDMISVELSQKRVDDEPSSDKVIAVSCGLRVGVFNDWTEAGPYCAGVSGAVYRACDTLEEARGAFLYAMDRGLVLVKGGGVAPDIIINPNNVSQLSGAPDLKVNGININSIDMDKTIMSYYARPIKKYYVVTAGIRTGVFSEWLEVGRYVLSVPGALCKAYETEASATHAFEDAIQDENVRVILVPKM